jgi:Dolichyl-phosphate-mannose-protein mannosyltransferase
MNWRTSGLIEPYQPVPAAPNALERLSIGMNQRIKRFLPAALVFGAFLLMIHWVQLAAGAPAAAFGGFPDEPAHYIGGLVAKDYLIHSVGKDPVSFVRDYHVHLPFFALGVWPPFFYLLEGSWMTVFGDGRAAILWLIAVSAAVLATLLFSMLRRVIGAWPAAAMSGMFLFAPVVQWSACLVMADLTCSVFALTAILYFARFLEKEKNTDAILFGAFCGISLLTKNSTFFVVLTPPIAIAGMRRWDLLRRPGLWMAAAIAACIYGPWLFVSRPFLLLGTYGLQLPGFWGIQWTYLAALWQQTSFLLPAGLLGAGWLVWGNRGKLDPVAWCMLATLPAISLGIFVARVPVQPRLLMVAYIALIYLAAQLCGIIADARWRMGAAAIALIVFASWNWPNVRLAANGIRSGVAFVQERDGERPGAVLVPSGSEGAWIAEFAQFEKVRPQRIFLRPTKLFGEEDWNGSKWKPYLKSAEDMGEFFRHLPVKYCILNSSLTGRRYPHDQLLESVVAGNPESWELVLEGGQGTASVYRIYENRHWIPSAELAVYQELYRRLPQYLR